MCAILTEQHGFQVFQFFFLHTVYTQLKTVIPVHYFSGIIIGALAEMKEEKLPQMQAEIFLH